MINYILVGCALTHLGGISVIAFGPNVFNGCLESSMNVYKFLIHDGFQT